MTYKIFELVAFNGRNGYRAIDRIRREIGLRLSDGKTFSFFSISNPRTPLHLLKKKELKHKTKRNKFDVLVWSSRIALIPFLNNYDIFHSVLETFTLPIINLIKFRNKRIKHLFTLHGLLFEDLYWDGKKIPRSEFEKNLVKLAERIINKADVVSAVSKTNCYQIEKRYNRECKLLLDGVDTKFFVPPKTEKKIDKPKFLYVGSFQRRKNILTAIDLAKNLSNVEVYLLGRGPLSPQLTSAALRIKNLKVIHDIVSKNQLLEIYKNSSVFFFPSLSEGLANVLLESISCGLPVLAANATSNPELVIDGLNGFLFNDTQEMIEKAKLLLDENLRRKMSKESRKIALQYDWSKIKDMHKQVFLETINE